MGRVTGRFGRVEPCRTVKAWHSGEAVPPTAASGLAVRPGRARVESGGMENSIPRACRNNPATSSAYEFKLQQSRLVTKMQFGIFSVGDVTTDPTTGRTPTEHERVKAMVTIALKAEEVGLDVFATGEHHNPPFVPSSPTTMLGYIAARTERLILSTSTTLITTNDPVKIAEDFAMLQHLADGRVDLMMGRGNTGPVYPWFGKDIRQGIPLAIENYALVHKLWREDVVDWKGQFRTPLQGFTSTPRPLDGVAPFVWHGSIRSPRSPSRPHTTATGSSPTTSSGPRSTSSGWSTSTASATRSMATAPPSRRSSASAGRCSCAGTPRTPSASSARTSTTPRCTATGRLWRSSPKRRR